MKKRMRKAVAIAATAANKGFLTSAEEFTGNYRHQKYFFDKTIYENRIFDSNGWFFTGRCSYSTGSR